MIKQPLSPIQYIQKEHADKALMVRMMADLMAIHKTFLDKHEEIKVFIDSVKKKGDKGDSIKGDDGKTPTRDELLEIIRPLIPKVKDGESVKGDDGKTPTREELLSIILPLIPEIKKEKLVLTDEHMDKIAEKASRKIKIPVQQKDELDIENVLSLIEKRPKGKRMNMDFIDGLSQTIQSLSSQITSKGYLHGGGDTVKAGSGVAITSDANGAKIISFSSSSGFQRPLTGALNQGTFTWTTAPNVIVVDGVPRQKLQTDGTQNWTGTTTTVLSIWPTFDVFSVN